MGTCADIADRYCLSDIVFPHVTLCQFFTKERVDLDYLQVKQTVSPVFLGHELRTGTGIHKGYTWFAMQVERDSVLLQAQTCIRNILLGLGYDVSTQGGLEYHPHLTFCRVKEEKADLLKQIVVPSTLYTPVDGWKFAVGKSDKNGQYLG